MGADYPKQLIKIDNARRELAEARTISETKTIHDKAEAIRIFTKQQNYSREIQDYATAFVLEAEIKLGKLLKDMPKNEGTKGQGRPKIGSTKMEPPKKDQPSTYKELGIDKKDASENWLEIVSCECYIDVKDYGNA